MQRGAVCAVGVQRLGGHGVRVLPEVRGGRVQRGVECELRDCVGLLHGLPCSVRGWAVPGVGLYRAAEPRVSQLLGTGGRAVRGRRVQLVSGCCACGVLYVRRGAVLRVSMHTDGGRGVLVVPDVHGRAAVCPLAPSERELGGVGELLRELHGVRRVAV